ncbi:MAG TPA: bifunctional PIG-L family deacetylase/class I SAM-dependent methyltransferase [Arthrobacter sp.]|nr:bifunctional PIG-L family deacetylase/class I SAM-dependent methyltransferase [Arthrobacter sp.]
MVSFSHTDAGTPEAAWLDAEVGSLAELPLGAEDLGAAAFVILAAHPDDETLGAGGLLCRLADLGIDVHVVLCTAGEASHPQSPTHSAEELAEVRLNEFRSGLEITATGAHWTFLGLPDGGLAAYRPRIAAAVKEALAHCDTNRDVVLVAPLRNDGHCDHEALGEVAARLAADEGYGLLEYPVWYWHWAVPDNGLWRDWLRLSLEPGETCRKEAALRVHGSQTEPLSGEPGDEALLPARFLEHFGRTWETFAWTPPANGQNSSADAERIFDAVHRSSRDPWDYASSWYEERKRALTLAVLPEEKYSSGLELGCSTGVLASELAERCGELLCLDASGEALEQARSRLRDLRHVRTAHLTIPARWPAGRYGLIVMSEIGYYLGADELETVLDKIQGSLLPGGSFVMCHWRHPIDGWPLDGDAVHAIARKRLDVPSVVLHREKDFILEVFTAHGSLPEGS